MSREQEYISREPRQYTKKEKLANWFYYYKWWLLVALILLYIVGSILWNKLGIGKACPDYSLAYVGSMPLPERCRETLEKELARLGEDVNGDGRVIVEVREYVLLEAYDDPENLAYRYAAEVTLAADVSEGESCFFLLEDPEAFQLNYQVLAHLDGSAPDDEDFDARDKTLCWGDCPILSGLDLGDFEEVYGNRTITGSCQERLSSLYFGRRFFDDGTSVNSREALESFWRILTEGAR